MSELSYFNHPFANGNRIMLIDDFNLENSISELSLASDFDGADIKTMKGERTAKARQLTIDDDEDLFDFDKAK